jgi:CubicO group peptidase (beta-lactamase class C family)
MGITRREFLVTAGSVAGATAVAGYLGGSAFAATARRIGASAQITPTRGNDRFETDSQSNGGVSKFGKVYPQLAAFEAYHGVTGAQHQANFDQLASEGFQLVSISVYGDPAAPLYAAVWVKRPAPPWVAVHGVDSSGYQAFFNNVTAEGYVPVLVSATGPVTNAVFAAVFRKGIKGPWFARHGMTSGPAANTGTFQNEVQLAHTNNMVISSFAIYGTVSDRRYAAIWHDNPTFAKWHVHPTDTASSYQTTFDAETQLPGYGLAGYRPAYVALSTDQTYCSVFKDDVVGPWVARHGMTSTEYQSEFDLQASNGYYPICVQGGGTGDQTRYAAIFATQDIPLSREWSVTGSNSGDYAPFDAVMQSFMQVNGVRAAQLTVAKDGVTKVQRAYTWAEAGYRQTQVSDVFLLASCSKIFTEAALQALYDSGKLAPTTAAYPLLGFSHPADPRSDSITVQQLLDHAGGYDDTSAGSGFDPTYNMRQIAVSEGLSGPVTKLDVCRYMYARDLDFDPGSKSVYSNYGYLLLSAVVERITGLTFFTYVQRELLKPLGITQVLVSSTVASQRASNQAICEDEGLGLSPIDLTSSALVPAVYGGDGQVKEVAVGCAGLAASATALTQFIHVHLVWGNGPRPPDNGNWEWERTGSTPGVSSWAASRGNGYDWAVVVNTRDWPNQKSPTFNDVGASIDSLITGLNP